MAESTKLETGISLSGPYGEGPVRVEEVNELDDGTFELRCTNLEAQAVFLHLQPAQLARLRTAPRYAEGSLEFEEAVRCIMQHEREQLYRPRDRRGHATPCHIETTIPEASHVRRIVVKPHHPEAESVTLTEADRELLSAGPDSMLAALPHTDEPPHPRPRFIDAAAALHMHEIELQADLSDSLIMDTPYIEVIGQRFAVDFPHAFERRLLATLAKCFRNEDYLADADVDEPPSERIQRCRHAGFWNCGTDAQFSIFADLMDLLTGVHAREPLNSTRWEAARSLFLEIYTADIPDRYLQADARVRWNAMTADVLHDHANLVRTIHRNVEYTDRPPILE